MHQTSWFIYASFPLEIRHFDEDCLVFHSGAGDTFVLDAFAAFLLALLTPIAQDAAQLTALVAVGLGVTADQSLQGQVQACLSDLFGLGLIECDTQ